MGGDFLLRPWVGEWPSVVFGAGHAGMADCAGPMSIMTTAPWQGRRWARAIAHTTSLAALASYSARM